MCPEDCIYSVNIITCDGVISQIYAGLLLHPQRSNVTGISNRSRDVLITKLF